MVDCTWFMSKKSCPFVYSDQGLICKLDKTSLTFGTKE